VAGPARYTVVAVVDVPPGGVAAFRLYEGEVLPLLRRHGGRVERRLSTPDGTTEVHVLSFVSEEGYRAYLGDPERARHRVLLSGCETRQRVVEAVSDVL
jgi:hypothetical protein